MRTIILTLVIVLALAFTVYVISMLTYDGRNYAGAIAITNSISNKFLTKYGSAPHLDRAPLRHCSKEEAKRIVNHQKSDGSHPYCSIVDTISNRKFCKYWWIGARCYAVGIREYLYEIPEVRKTVEDSGGYLCEDPFLESYENKSLYGICNSFESYFPFDVHLVVLETNSQDNLISAIDVIEIK